MGTTSAQKKFGALLLTWHDTENERELPWKNEKDPYKIWLSEVILQQTRAEQGLPYYLKFTGTYPTVQALAAADDDDVFRLWQGLGYYNRCKNMLKAARYIALQNGGKMPQTYDELVQLPGIGTYTAAAIASFAYDLPHPVIDGNVYRVLSRCFAIKTPVDTTIGKSEIAVLASKLISGHPPARFNQAIMDLGATVCKPAAPICAKCPLETLCVASKQDLIQILPIKIRKTNVTERHFLYFVIENDNHIYIHKRGDNDIWANLYEPYFFEANTGSTDDIEILSRIQDSLNLNNLEVKMAGKLRQRLTHQLITSTFYVVSDPESKAMLPAGFLRVSIHELNKYAFPKSTLTFLTKKYMFKFH